MIKAWQDFLQAQGATFDPDGTVAHFGEPAVELARAGKGDVLADLSGLGLLSVTGKDALNLLQGQLTNDMRDVSPKCSQLSGMCSPKGRLLSSFRVIRTGDGYYLLLPQDLLQSTMARLRMFVLRADVALADADEQAVRFGVQGRGVMDALAQAFGELPEEPDQASQSDGLHLVRLVGNPAPRFLILGETGQAEALWTRLAAAATPVGAPAWALTEVQAGVPSLSAGLAEVFVPQMINYQALGGVSFTKGCYAGQEVVARTEYLGKLKRRMYRARVAADHPPLPGEELFAANSASGQGTGRIVNAAPHPEGGYEVLAVIQIESAENDSVHLRDLDGPRLELEELPYSLAD